MSEPKAAVFDLDGTLILSEHRNRAVWEAFFDRRRLAHEVDDELVRRLTGRRGEDSLADLAHLFPGESPQDLLAEVTALEDAPDLPAIEHAPGAADYVRRLAAAGVPMGLVTSARRPYVVESLTGLGVAELFGVIVAAEDVTVGKPDPEGYLRAVDGLGVAPADAVGFEDSEAGVAAVRAAGMRCVALASTLPPAAFAGADLVVESFEGLAWPPPLGRD
jgi:sugar-phosphatase